MSALIIIRCSALSSWADCPRRSAANLFRREIEAAGYRLRWLPRSIAALIGSAVHRGAEIELKEKAETGRLPPVTVALDASRDHLVDSLQRGEVMFDGRTTHNLRDASSQVVMMGHVYHHQIAPQVTPISVEQRLEAEIEAGLILSGQPDVVCHEPGAIRDLKTGARPPSSWMPQVGAYALLSRSHGFDIETAAIDFIQRVSVKSPQPDPVTKRALVADAEDAAGNILAHIIGTLKAFRHGDPERRIAPGDSAAFLPNPSSNLCSAKWCSAHGTEFCSAWKQREGGDRSSIDEVSPS